MSACTDYAARRDSGHGRCHGADPGRRSWLRRGILDAASMWNLVVQWRRRRCRVDARFWVSRRRHVINDDRRSIDNRRYRSATLMPINPTWRVRTTGVRLLVNQRPKIIWQECIRMHSSAACARQTHSPYVGRLQWDGTCPPKNCPLTYEIRTPSNTWFLGSTWVSLVNGISIGLAVFAQLTPLPNTETHRPRCVRHL